MFRNSKELAHLKRISASHLLSKLAVFAEDQEKDIELMSIAEVQRQLAAFQLDPAPPIGEIKEAIRKTIMRRESVSGKTFNKTQDNIRSERALGNVPSLQEGSYMFELFDSYRQCVVIKVIGIGGGGSNAVQHMVDANIDGIEFICANTDAQALTNMSARTTLQLGSSITKGLGAGANPDIGRQAAIEDRDRIREVIEGSDMLFITAGMGGGTGTGAAPVVAQVAKELGILTVAVVTLPFSFEGGRRWTVADRGLVELSQYVDSLITIPNEKLLSVLGKDVSLLNAFKAANNVLQGAVQGIAELVMRPGFINVDFADVRTVMSEMGMAMMGTGLSSGQDRAREAAEAAVHSPLLEDIDFMGANGILVNVTAGLDLSIGEFEEVGNTVKELASRDATVAVGTVIDPEMHDELRVTVVVTGLGSQLEKKEEKPEPVKLVQRNKTGEVNYAALDRAAVIRRKAAGDSLPPPSSADDMDYLDIPAFLRRQAD